MVILGIDPGLANTGWGIVEERRGEVRCRAYGCIETSSGSDLAARLRRIADELTAVVDRYRPQEAAVEGIYFGANVRSAIPTAHARGAALVACSLCGVEVGEYTPMQIKQAVVGTGAADKTQVTYMVRTLLHLDHDPKPDHAADAGIERWCLHAREGKPLRMISILNGTLIEATAGSAVIDVNGIGFELGISATTASSLAQVGSPTRLYTRMVVREDSCTLFGFATKDERTMFDKLVSVSGVGAKLALAILSSFTVPELYTLVMMEDDKGMATVPGVGKKTAQRLILELKGVFEKDRSLAGSAAPTAPLPFAPAAPAAPSAIEDATAALLSMGFTAAEVTLALDGYDGKDMRVEELLALALRRLGMES